MNKYISIAIVVVIISMGVWFFTKDKNIEQVATTPDVISEALPIEQTEKIEDQENITNLEDKKTMNATLQTNKGNIKIEFYADSAPKTVENFTKLAKDGFYNGVKFHRVIKGFMIQAGDPLSKDDTKSSLWGTGGPGYKFADEIDAKSDLYTKVGYKKGVVAMANSGPNTNGSQFFIMHTDYPLPPLYTIFGKVVAGQEVVDAIAMVATGPNDRPVDPVIIESIKVE